MIVILRNFLIKFKRRNLLISLLFSFVFIWLIVLLLPIRFEENDDVVMLLLASGNYTGQFESNLIFINPLFGKIVALLYSISNRIEWYTILFVIFHWASLGIITYKLLELKIPNFVKITLIVFFSVVCANFLMYLQFTTVALFLCIAAFFMFSSENLNKKEVVLPIIFIFLASLIRPEMVLLVVVSIFPFFIFKSLIKKDYFRLGMTILLIVMPFFSIQLRDNFLLSTEWKEATKYSRLRAEVTDNINADYSIENYRDVCSEGDYKLLKQFFIAPDFFNFDKLKALKNNVQQKESLATKLKNIPLQLKNYIKEFLLLGMLLLILFLRNPLKKSWLLLLLYGGFLMALAAYLSLDGLLKNRVFIGFVLVYLIVILHSLPSISTLAKFHFYRISIVLVLFSVYYLRRLNEKIEETNYIRSGYLENQVAFISNYFKRYPNSTLIPFGDDLKIQYLNPFEISRKTKKWNLFYLGWMTNYPYNQKYEHQFKSTFSVFMTNYNYQKNGIYFENSEYYRNYKEKELFGSSGFTVRGFKK